MTYSEEAQATASDDSLTKVTADVVSAYLSNNNISATEVPDFIQNVFAALTQIVSSENNGGRVANSNQKPAVPIKKSIHPDYLICLEDGKKFKTLKRHLSAHYGMTPEEYRAKWGLPPDYPMTASSYSERRASIAKETRLGLSRRKA